MKYRKLWQVVKVLLSHGQATVERGFSVNREVETVNMHEETIVAQRLICDHIYSVGGVLNVALSKELASASASRQQYALHLEELRKAAEKDVCQQKRKAVSESIQAAKKRKTTLDSTIVDLFQSADELSERAERESKMSLLAHVNSLCRIAKEKQNELKEVEKLFVDQLKEQQQITAEKLMHLLLLLL